MDLTHGSSIDVTLSLAPHALFRHNPLYLYKRGKFVCGAKMRSLVLTSFFWWGFFFYTLRLYSILAIFSIISGQISPFSLKRVAAELACQHGILLTEIIAVSTR